MVTGSRMCRALMSFGGALVRNPRPVCTRLGHETRGLQGALSQRLLSLPILTWREREEQALFAPLIVRRSG